MSLAESEPVVLEVPYSEPPPEEVAPPRSLAEAQPAAADESVSPAESEPLPLEAPYIEPPREEVAPPRSLAEAQPAAAEVPVSLATSEPLVVEARYSEPPRDEVALPSERAEPEILALDIPLAAGDPPGVAIEDEEQATARLGNGPVAEPEVARPLAAAPTLAEPPRSQPPLPRGIPIYGATAAPGLRGPSGSDAGSRTALAEDLAEMIGSMLSSTEFATNAGAKAREAERLVASNSGASTQSLDEALMQALPPPPPAPAKRRGLAERAMGLAVAGMMVAGGYFAYSLYFTERLLPHEASTVVAMALLPPVVPAEVSAAAIDPVGPETAIPKPTPAAAHAAPAAKDARAKRTR
jgi:hypothetical protein